MFKKLKQQLSGLRSCFRKTLDTPVEDRKVSLDLRYLEDRVLYSVTPIPPELISSGEIAGDTLNVAIDSQVFPDAGYHELVTENPSSSTPARAEDYIEQLESSLKGLEEMLQKLGEKESGIESPRDPSIFLPNQENTIINEDFSTTVNHELIVVDSSVPDIDQLILALDFERYADRDFTILYVDANSSGIDLISEFLNQSTERIDAIHLVTHGFSGGVQLGEDVLTSGSLSEFAGRLESWRTYLTADADLFLYGCSIADTTSGTAFLDQLAVILKVDVAASSDATGAEAVGGDWELEYQIGIVGASLSVSELSGKEWLNLLLTQTVRDNFNTASWTNNDGSASWLLGWNEVDANGIGPTAGDIWVVNSQLQLAPGDISNSLSRMVDLETAQSATLTFDFDSTIDDNANISGIDLEVSDDTVNWVVIDSFDNLRNTVAGSKSYDLTPYMSSQTTVRFVVTTADSRLFNLTVDNFQIAYTTNTAPILDAAVNPVLTSIPEGVLNPSGMTIASLIVDGSITDPDGSSVEAIAITGLNASLGAWQYSLDDGVSWLTINAELINSQTEELALLLGPSAQLRLIPFGLLNGTISNAISFRAWDQSSGTEGQYTTITSTGGDSSFSSISDTAAITVTSVNDAPTFLSGGGIVTTDIGGGDNTGQSIVIQSDGKVLVGGYASVDGTDDFALVRYNADGSLDTSFGIGGVVVTSIGNSHERGASIALQSDGKIVLGGYARMPNFEDFALVRYNADGSLDTSFGTDGKVTTAITASTDLLYSVMVQPDGKILAAGQSRTGNSDFALTRYNEDGSLDNSFGSNGIVTTALGVAPDVARSIALQADGKIVLAGYYLIPSEMDFALVRYNSDGSLDGSFGTGGKVTTDIGTGNDYGYSVTVQQDGKILLGGSSAVGSNHEFSLARYNIDGSLDSSFGSGGIVTTSINSGDDVGRSIVVQPDGKILLGGLSNNGSSDEFALVRYNINGSLDTSFGLNGTITTSVSTGNDQGWSVKLQPDGKIVVGGFATIGSTADIALVRYNADGTLDTRFNTASTLGGFVNYTENGSPVVLDSNVQIFDAELSSENFNGATLTLVRNGGASSEDIYSATGSLSALTQGGNLIVGGTTIGTVTSNSGGTLVLNFNGNATNVLVNSAIQQIAYSNSSDAPPASVQIDWTFSDGNSGGQGSGGVLTATGNVVVNITSLNDAPTITSGAIQTLEPTFADTASSGTLASAILGGVNWNDVDPLALSGLAITSVTGNGTWQYSSDGTAWTDFGAVSSTNALLITSTDQIRYRPNTPNAEMASFSFKAWDQTTGIASANGTPSYANTSSSGGATAFSTNNAVAQISVISVNNAPVLAVTNEYVYGIEAGTGSLVRYDLAGQTQTTVVAGIGANNALSYDGTRGHLYYFDSFASGNNLWFVDISGASPSTPVQLGSASSMGLAGADQGTESAGFYDGALWIIAKNKEQIDRVTFSYAGNTPSWQSTSTYTFTNIDTATYNISGGDIAISADGQLYGTSQFSSGALFFSLDLTQINDTNKTIPWQLIRSGTGMNLGSLAFNTDGSILYGYNTLASTGWYAIDTSNGTTSTISYAPSQVNDAASSSWGLKLATVNEDNGAPSAGSISGSTTTFSFASYITDADTLYNRGIAITGVDTSKGTLWYSTNNGTTWQQTGSVSSSNALLLNADTSTRLYFQANADFNGTVDNAITFLAWDRALGASGTKVDPGAYTATGAFSSTSLSASLIVLAVNDAPVAMSDTALASEAGGVGNGTAGINPTGNVLTNDIDIDTGDTRTVSGVAAGVVGIASTHVGSNLSGTYGTINIAADGSYIYNVDNNNVTVQALGATSNTLTDVFTYTMRDAAGLNSTSQITITIRGANDAPNDISGVLTIAENSSNGTVVGTVAAQDVDAGDAFTYSLIDNANGRFAINSSTGQVTVANGSLLDFETNVSHDITVRVTDTASEYIDKVMTVAVTDVAPTTILDGSASPSFGIVLEGASNPSGVMVSSLIVDGSITSTDGVAVEAIAITALNTSLGTWQYSLDGGGNWLSIQSDLINNTTNQLALLLGPTAQLRLVPYGDLTGSISDAITFYAWSQSTGSEGNYVVISATGPGTAFSSVSDTAAIQVTGVNDAPTFSRGDGIVTMPIGTGDDLAYSAVIQPDGKILLAGLANNGTNNEWAISRFNSDGSLDTSFGSGTGRFITGFSSGDNIARSITLQPDGKILVAGFTGPLGDEFALMRLNSNGTLDSTFSGNGMLTTSFGSDVDRARSVVVQPDGKIVVGGFASVGGTDHFAIARYLPDGTLDTTFSGDGMRTQLVDDYAQGWTLAVQHDSKILLGGYSINGDVRSFVVMRFNVNGSLDTTFSGDGITSTVVGSGTGSTGSMVIQPNGRIIVAGSATVNGNEDFALVRYYISGALDTFFGTGGKITTPIGTGTDSGLSVTMQADGKILVGGRVFNGSNYDFGIARYTSNGVLDNTFGIGGKFTQSIGPGDDSVHRVLVQADGKIVLAGVSNNGVDSDFALLRLNSNGTLDTTFDLSGTLGGAVTYTTGTSPVVLDSNVHVFDAELNAGTYNGATLTLSRSGGANSGDQFSAVGVLGALSQGGDLVVQGVAIGTVTSNSDGRLDLTFNANASATLVNTAMQNIAYRYVGVVPPNPVQIQWSFSDSNTGGQGTGGALTATGSVTVNLIQGNTKPIALPEQFETDASTKLQVVSPTILSNDYDPDGTSLSAILVSGPSRGSLSLQSDGRFTYDPDPSFLGAVSFVYVASDGSLNSDPQSVTITVTAPPSIDTTRLILSQPSTPTSQPQTPSEQGTGESNLVVQPPESSPLVENSIDQKKLSVSEAKTELGPTIAASREFRGALSDRGIGSKNFGISSSEYKSGEISQSLRSDFMELQFVESVELQVNLSITQNQVANTQVIFGRSGKPEDGSLSVDAQESIQYQFVGREKQKEIEDQSEDLFFQAVTPIAVGTAISAGISIHLILTSQIGTVLLSQSTFVVPLDPLTMLDSSAKVNKSRELEDQLFEAASIKKSRSNG
jgi:uncharacterized delta-60 repeat protein